MYWQINRQADLIHPERQIAFVGALMYGGDRLAHTWSVEVYNDQVPYWLDGCTIKAYFLRADGTTIKETGTYSGAIAQVSFPPAAYAVPGQMSCIMRCVKDDVLITLDAIRVNILDNPDEGVIVDSGETIPSIDELVSMISEMEAAIESAKSAEAAALRAAERAELAVENMNARITATDDGAGTVTIYFEKEVDA